MEPGEFLEKNYICKVNGMSLSASTTDNNLFVTGSVKSSAKVWDIHSGKHVQTYVVNESNINSALALDQMAPPAGCLI